MDFFSKLFNQPKINQLEPVQVQDRVKVSPKPFLLDVRTPGEYKEGHIHRAKLIPLDEMSAKMNQIPKESEIICVCASGSRSLTAARQLHALGYKVSNLKGGMSQWVRAGLPQKKGMNQ